MPSGQPPHVPGRRIKAYDSGMEGAPEQAERPRLSVCITTRDRPELLASCLSSLLAQESAPPFELLVSCQGTPVAAEVVDALFPDATVGFVDGAHCGGARNFLVERSRGEWLLFLDDDVTCPSDLLASFVSIIDAHPNTDVVGGPNVTPDGSPLFEQVQGSVLSSFFATGPIRARYGAHRSGPADERSFNLCNLAIRRSVMVPFPSENVGGEETVVLSELARRGVRMHYDPSVAVAHARRPSLGQFARQIYKYGFGRGEAFVCHPNTRRTIHALPLLLIGWFVALPALAILVSPLFLASLGIYAAFVAAGGVRIGLTSTVHGLARVRYAVTAMTLIVLVHLTYGVGLIGGMIRRRRIPPSAWVDHRPHRAADLQQPAPSLEGLATLRAADAGSSS